MTYVLLFCNIQLPTVTRVLVVAQISFQNNTTQRQQPNEDANDMC